MYIVFDIGGTQMRLAGSEDGETLMESVSIATPPDPADAIEQFAELAADVAGGNTLAAVAGGVAGPLNKDRSRLIQSPHLSDWVGFPLKETLRKQCGIKDVYLENDTALVGLGESVVGGGEGFEIVAYITVSTGVGGVRVVNDAIDATSIGFEPGHQIINIHDFNDIDDIKEFKEGNIPGHLEYYVSGTSMERRYDTHPKNIEDPEKWRALEHQLVVGLNNIAVMWSPDAIVLGGSMIVKKTGIDLNRVREQLDDMLSIFPKSPGIKKAELGDTGGLHGALAYIRQRTV